MKKRLKNEWKSFFLIILNKRKVLRFHNCLNLLLKNWILKKMNFYNLIWVNFIFKMLILFLVEKIMIWVRSLKILILKLILEVMNFKENFIRNILLLNIGILIKKKIKLKNYKFELFWIIKILILLLRIN